MKSLLFSTLILLITAVTLGTGTLAWFHDAATSMENSFTAGTLDLRIRDGDERDWRKSVTATWTMTNMVPGDTYYSYVDLKNIGTLGGSSLDVQAANTVVAPVEEAGDMARMLEIVDCAYTNGHVLDCRELIADANGNGWKDLDDLAAGPFRGPWDSTGGVHSWEMRVRFHPSADNRYQGHTLLTDLTFTLNQ